MCLGKYSFIDTTYMRDVHDVNDYYKTSLDDVRESFSEFSGYNLLYTLDQARGSIGR